jgi:replication fork clamp-binding protein CrfC
VIQLMNKLQEVFALTGSAGGQGRGPAHQLDLPQLVVCGAQSAGKSSVIENLVGRDFLPRGSNLVTRCPTIVQLQRLEDAPPALADGASPDGFATFSHRVGAPNSGSRRFEIGDVAAEIARQTREIAGPDSHRITSQPIVLQLYVPGAIPLTLVDTPGMTRVAVGDQPADIEARIRSIVMDYIRRDNAIILAVHSANQDLATSDALNLALAVDRDGARTVGVLTKIDLMDRGTSAVDILNNSKYPLKLQWYGMVSRSQADTEANKSIADSLGAEQEFFASTRFASVRQNVGTKNLALRTNELLADHIRRRLPDVRRQIDALEKDARDALARYGEGVPGAGSDSAAQGWYLMHILTAFVKQFAASIDGDGGDAIFTEHVAGGARIRQVFNERFASAIDALQPVDALGDSMLRSALRNASGATNSLFVPQKAFEALARKSIAALRPVAQQCVADTAVAMRQIAANVAGSEKSLARHAALRRRLDEVASELVERNTKRCTELVDALIECELAFINSNHPDFIGGAAALQAAASHKTVVRSSSSPPPPPPRNNPTSSHSSSSGNSNSSSNNANNSGWFGGLFSNQQPQQQQQHVEAAPSARVSEQERVRQASVSEREAQQVELMRSLLGSYFEIVRGNMRDLIPKVVMKTLVIETKSAMQDELVRELFKETAFNVLLAESAEAVAAREKARQQLQASEQASKILRMSVFQ